MNKLLTRLPQKYYNRVKNLEAESGLIDNCKYIVTFADGWYWGYDYKTLPCKTLKEAMRFIKETEKR